MAIFSDRTGFHSTSGAAVKTCKEALLRKAPIAPRMPLGSEQESEGRGPPIPPVRYIGSLAALRKLGGFVQGGRKHE